ncbi:hypothetical protein Fuma_05195 [Fuerstiella marisgermanici]|uniref:Uncharacterized protein n=2 Tax=Fuerstiella marisgermanici TaxID=1891926 RepID=A0A1P8WN95_9PLAN|nr:hypothetical protein Fuma_05195 [Fuerstiella marisgermanici]
MPFWSNHLLRRFAGALCVIFVCTGVLSGRVALSQESPNANSDNEPAAPMPGFIESLKPGSSTVIYKDPTSGEVIALPGFSDEILKEVQKRALLQNAVQLYELQELKIEGTVKGDFVELQVKLSVDVRQDQEWVEVPVGFNGYQLTDIRYTPNIFQGKAQPEKTRLPFKSWMFYGKGTHHLTLNLIGSVRVSSNGRRRLRLDAPSATISHLLLNLSDQVDAAELSSDQPSQLKTDPETGTSVFETWGLSETTDISWTPTPRDAGMAVTVQATAAAKMELDLATASLVIDQPLSITGGSIDRLKIKLPPGFGTVAINGRNADDEEIAKPVDQPDEGSVVLEFTAPVTGAIVLHYDLALNNVLSADELSIQLPDIDRVANESGDIEIYAPLGLEVVPERPGTRDVRQKRVETSRGPRTAVFGYRLLSSESVLRMKVSETEASFIVVPHISFETEGSNILMTARFSINMVSGSLNEMNIVWPGYSKDRWTILSGDTRLIDGDSSETLAGFPSPDVPDTYTVSFGPERISGQFEIEIQAFRARNSTQDAEGFSIVLPDIVSPTPHTTIVSLIESDEFSMSVSPQDSQSTFPLLPSSRWPESLKQRNVPLTARLVDATEQAVQIRITPQKPEVKVSVKAAISVRQESVYVRQQLTFDVRHRDLSEIRLSVPGVNPSVRFGDSEETLQRLSVEGSDITYALPEPVRDIFHLQIDYYWPPDSLQAKAALLPLVLPSSTEQELTEIVIGTNEPESIVVDRSADWGRIYSEEFSAAWVSDTRQATVAVNLRHSLQNSNDNKPRFLVLKSAVQGSELVTAITGVYQQPVKRALFSLPKGVVAEEGFLGGEQAFIDNVSPSDDGNSVIQVRSEVAHRPEQPRTITLIVRQPFQRRSPMLSLWRPQVPEIVGMNQDCNVIWILNQSPSESTMYYGRHMTDLATLTDVRLLGHSNAGVKEAVTALLSPYQTDIFSSVMELIGSAADATSDNQILAGPLLRDAPVLISVSRSVTLLLAAAVGLLVYFSFLKLSPIPLMTSTAIVTAAATALVAVVPGPAQLILIRLVPGAVIALVAALLQRGINRRADITPLSPEEYDHSTIFTVEKPAITSDGRQGSTASGAIPSAASGLSVS